MEQDSTACVEAVVSGCAGLPCSVQQTQHRKHGQQDWPERHNSCRPAGVFELQRQLAKVFALPEPANLEACAITNLANWGNFSFARFL